MKYWTETRLMLVGSLLRVLGEPVICTISTEYVIYNFGCIHMQLFVLQRIHLLSAQRYHTQHRTNCWLTLCHDALKNKRNKQAAIMAHWSTAYKQHCTAATVARNQHNSWCKSKYCDKQNVQQNVCAKCLGIASSLLLACKILLVMLRLTSIFQIKSHAAFGPDSQIVT